MTKFYGVLSSTKKVKERGADGKISDVKKPVDYLLTSDFSDRSDAVRDIKTQAKVLGGGLKFIRAFSK